MYWKCLRLLQGTFRSSAGNYSTPGRVSAELEGNDNRCDGGKRKREASEYP